MLEEIDKRYSNPLTRYDARHMIDAWLSHPWHRGLVLPPPMNELFCLLDKELIIGDLY